MKIYTKGGDKGETGLYGGIRVSKDSPRIEAYGTLDELNSALGVALAAAPSGEASVDAQVRAALQKLQAELFQLGAELANPEGKGKSVPLVGGAEVTRLEGEIDRMEAELPPLTHFLLPGGTPVGAALHLGRTISRRAERLIVQLQRSAPLRPEVLQYMNRLSDYLFVCARYVNFKAGAVETPWIAGH